jgi:cation diffusion facilitator CzcD-associated flavoprotein CzcO
VGVPASEYVDVLIVGAGLSGIGAACHLQDLAPGRSFAIVEARAASGGTWDLFRFPGIRSDSDMFTLGYTFRPWTAANAIAGRRRRPTASTSTSATTPGWSAPTGPAPTPSGR